MIYRKRVFCADLRIGDEVDDVFCVGRIVRRTGRKGPFLTMEFIDRSGRVPGVAWDEVDSLAALLTEGGYARVRGRVTSFREEPQVEILEAAAAPPELDAGEYLPTGPVPAARSIAGIRRLALTLGDDDLRRLVLAFLDDASFVRRFAEAPAAKVHHHAYVGGLAEHTLSVMELCALAADHYAEIDRDLLLAGAFLHDIGKTAELAVVPGFPYTEEGSLLGHIALGFAIVRERIARMPSFPADRATDVGHLVLSHQGELEWGSPVQPQTLEAVVLHFLDNLDSKVGTARPHLASVESGRTGWVKALGRALFRRPAGAPPDRPRQSATRERAPRAEDRKMTAPAREGPTLFDDLDRPSD